MYWINFRQDINKIRILKVLQAHPNIEVNAWKLSFEAKVLHYTQAIMELRKEGYIIINRTEHEWRTMHSFYKLIVE